MTERKLGSCYISRLALTPASAAQMRIFLKREMKSGWTAFDQVEVTQRGSLENVRKTYYGEYADSGQK